MRYLTFLDYDTLEAIGRSYETAQKENEQRIQKLEAELKEEKEVAQEYRDRRPEIEWMVTTLKEMAADMVKLKAA
jgi:CHASE3 domain sensor protein